MTILARLWNKKHQEKTMINILKCFCVVLILTEGSSVKVHPGGNATFPCSIEDDKEISWIITNGKQTFVRILKLEYFEGYQSKPEPIHIHPSYAGRIRAFSSSTSTHSLLLMNITDTDLMLYCCTECTLEQTHCTKLDYEVSDKNEAGEVSQEYPPNIAHIKPDSPEVHELAYHYAEVLKNSPCIWSIEFNTPALDKSILNIHNHHNVASSGFSVLMIVTKGSSVEVHPGGNTILPCSIKNNTEINWIITNGNQTFIRILKLEYLYGGKFKPEPSNIHPSFAGRITALISPINTHSLLLMNITDTDLMLYCCMDFTLEQSHCTKLDYIGDVEVSAEDADKDTATINHDPVINIIPWLPVISVLLLLLLVSSVYVCWRGTGLWKGCGRTNNLNRDWIYNSVQRKTGQGDWTLAEVLYTQIP